MPRLVPAPTASRRPPEGSPDWRGAWWRSRLRLSLPPSCSRWRPAPVSRSAAPADRSIQVHSCHGRSRQVEVLREVVLGCSPTTPPSIPATFWSCVPTSTPSLPWSPRPSGQRRPISCESGYEIEQLRRADPTGDEAEQRQDDGEDGVALPGCPVGQPSARRTTRASSRTGPQAYRPTTRRPWPPASASSFAGTSSLCCKPPAEHRASRPQSTTGRVRVRHRPRHRDRSLGHVVLRLPRGHAGMSRRYSGSLPAGPPIRYGVLTPT